MRWRSAVLAALVLVEKCVGTQTFLNGAACEHGSGL